MGANYMQGWDVIVAARQTQVNQAIGIAYLQGQIPKEFNVDLQINFLGIPIEALLQGVFGAMQIVGGSGLIATILFPINVGTITPLNGPSFDIAGANLLVNMNLSYIESKVQPSEGFNYDITIDFTNKNALVGVQLNDLPPALQGQETAISIALTQYLQQYTADKSYSVATVNLKNFAADPAFPYIVPKLVQYAMLTSSQSAGMNTIAMLMQSVSANPGALQLLEGTIPNNDEAAVLISNPIFLQHMVAPSLATGFNFDGSQLTFVSDPDIPDSVIITNNGNIYTTINADGERDIRIETLTVRITANSLAIGLRIRYEVSPGIDLIYTVDPSRYVFDIVEVDGKQSLNLREVEFNNSKDVDIAWWVWVVGGAAAILALPIVGPIIAAIIGGVGIAIVAIIRAIVQDKAPDLKGSMLVDAAKPVAWSYSELFRPIEVLLPQGMQAGGSIPLLASATPERAIAPLEEELVPG